MSTVEPSVDDSVTAWIERLRLGDRNAGDLLHRRYGQQLASTARAKFPNALTPASDEHDLTQSVFCALWKVASEGGLKPVDNRSSFWWLLLGIARNKAISRLRAARAAKRQGDGRGREHIDDHLNSIVDPAPSPELVQAFFEEQEALFALLRDEAERAIAVLKLEGFNHPEIAGKLGLSVRTVERKAAIIREKWANYAESEEGYAGNDSKDR
jgi:RNA polymerase sigma factor (sigma-70 family)